MSLLVEAQIGRKTSAKDILFEFMTEFEKKLLALKDYRGYFDIIQREVKSGEILFASQDESVSGLAEEILGNTEGWKKDTGNFIYPIFTSLSANKSDRYMKRDFRVTSRMVADTSAVSLAASGAVASATSGTNSAVPPVTPVASGPSSAILNSFVLETTHTMTIDDREKIRALLYEFEVPKEKHEQLIFVE